MKYALVSKRAKLIAGTDGHLYTLEPTVLVHSDPAMILFRDKAEAERMQAHYVSPKFKIVEIA